MIALWRLIVNRCSTTTPFFRYLIIATYIQEHISLTDNIFSNFSFPQNKYYKVFEMKNRKKTGQVYYEEGKKILRLSSISNALVSAAAIG